MSGTWMIWLRDFVNKHLFNQTQKQNPFFIICKHCIISYSNEY